MSKVVIGCDHGALDLKNEIKTYLESKHFTVTDLGVHSNESVDYPDIAKLVCNEYLNNQYEFGIILCGTGIGVSIASNKINGIRCALPQNSFAAAMAREHNNANIIAFGGRIDYPEPVTEILQSFVSSIFQGERHARRIEKLMNLEK